MTKEAAPAKAPESPPQAGLQPDPAPTSPSIETPTPGPGPEAEPPPDGGVPGAEAEPQQPWWTSAESEESLWEHEDAKSRLEESDREGFKRGRTETQQRMQGFLQQQTQHLNSIDGGVQKFVRDFNKIAKSEDADAEAISNLLDDHAATFEALRGVHQEAGKWVGAKGVLAEMSKALEDSGFYTEFAGRLDSISQGMTDPALFPDIVARVSEAAIKQARAKWEKEDGKKATTRVEAELRAEARGGTKPPAKPAGGAGGGGTLSKPEDLDNISTSEWLAMPPERRQGLLDEARKLSVG